MTLVTYLRKSRMFSMHDFSTPVVRISRVCTLRLFLFSFHIFATKTLAFECIY